MSGFPFEIDSSGWIEVLPNYQRTTIIELLGQGKTEEQIAESWLSKAGAQTNFGFGATGTFQSFFENVKSEFAAFICGDPKYEKERSEAAALWKGGKLSLVTFVSAVIATNVGLAAVAVIPVVSLFFSVVGKVGLQAFCQQCGRSDANADAAKA